MLDRVVKIKRCAAVVKGGRRFSFAAMVVVGDGKGKVGWGYGKANEVPPSVQKAQKQASRSLIDVPLVEGSIPHQVWGTLRCRQGNPCSSGCWYGDHRWASCPRRLRSDWYP